MTSPRYYGATHRHKDTQQLLKVSGNRVYRLNAERKWVTSTISLDEALKRGEEL